MLLVLHALLLAVFVVVVVDEVVEPVVVLELVQEKGLLQQLSDVVVEAPHEELF